LCLYNFTAIWLWFATVNVTLTDGLSTLLYCTYTFIITMIMYKVEIRFKTLWLKTWKISALYMFWHFRVFDILRSIIGHILRFSYISMHLFFMWGGEYYILCIRYGRYAVYRIGHLMTYMTLSRKMFIMLFLENYVLYLLLQFFFLFPGIIWIYTIQFSRKIYSR